MRSTIALVGLSGTGKTTVGALLAHRLGCSFYDIDATVEAYMGMTINEAFATQGEAWFRGHEADVVRQVLQEPYPRVVALGAGAVEHPKTRRVLQERALTVWLWAPFRVLAARLAGCTDRPLFAEGDVSGTLESMARRRNRLYAEVAGMRVNVTGTPETSVAWIMRRLDARELASR